MLPPGGHGSDHDILKADTGRSLGVTMKGRGLEYRRESPSVEVWPSQAHSSAEP